MIERISKGRIRAMVRIPKILLKLLLTVFIFIILLVAIKWLWVSVSTFGHGTFDGEKTEILRRRNYLTNMLVSSPDSVLSKMPAEIGPQFQGEWAMYSCSMLSAALVNISKLYPEEKEKSVEQIDRLIEIVMSPELRAYDKNRWDEDPLESWDSEKSHMSYLSILAWMISGYKTAGGTDKYDELYYKICSTLEWRMKKSPSLNLLTYPYEAVYVPDMLVTIVALSNYTNQCDDRYRATVNEWLDKAKKEWTDKETGLLNSFLKYNGIQLSAPVGSYSALICYYLTFVDDNFARVQYELLKKHFMQHLPITGIREYYDHSCWFGMSIDSGPILFNLSPSGTGFAIGPATYFGDTDFRRSLLKTGEIAGFTVRGRNTNHYLLADFAIVGEAIILAMRTSVPWFDKRVCVQNIEGNE
jgi:hypothetical protein